MKILLTQPLIKHVEAPPSIPDLGLGYIASSLRKNGHDVSIRDWNMNPEEDDLKSWLAKNKPEVVGIKIFTKDVYAAKQTIAVTRETLPETFIVIGGPHASCVESPDELMQDFDGCDYAVAGEAEFSLPKLLDELSKNGDSDNPLSEECLRSIPGLIWKSGEGVSSNSKSLFDNLDEIGFPLWEMINPNNYRTDMLGSDLEGPAAPVITTRGCPGKCTFCSAFNINGRRIRSRTPSHVFEEISMLYNDYGVRKLMFQDNCFTQNQENLMAICESMIKSGMKMEWDCVTYERLDNLTMETLSTMYKAGCRMIHMGIESGSEKTRKVMNKWCSLGEIKEKVGFMRQSGICVGSWFMLGFPGETKKDMKDTINYAFSLNADLLTFTMCFPLPGSRVYSYIKDKYKFDKIDWANFDQYNSPYPVSELSSVELKRLLKSLRLRLRINRKLKRFKSLVGMK